MNPFKKLSAIAGAVLCCAAQLAVAGDLSVLDALIEKEMKAARVPGVAVAVVRDDQVIFSKTYGYRDLERKLPVTQDTVFRIGSITKSMTAASAGLLVQAQRLEWDKPVREYVPELRLQDSFATERMTIRDMLTHRSGLPRHDMVWFHEDLPRAEYVRRLRFLDASADFRTRFQYNNLIYTAAGYVVGRAAGGTWEEWLQHELFVPLEMKSTTTSLAALTASAERSFGYGNDDDGQPIRIDDTSVDSIAPAGAVNSTIGDMSRYALMYVNGGKAANGRQLLSSAVLDEMQLPQISVPMRAKFPEIGPTHYGFGLFVSSYRGHRHIYHTGAYEGFNASLSWLPDRKIGVVILANHNLLLNFMQVITNRAFDAELGIEPIDWRARFGATEPGARAPGAKRSVVVPATEVKPARPLTEYTGRFEHPAYGLVAVRTDASGGLELEFHGDRFPLRPVKVDLFETADRPNSTHPLDKTKVSFLAADDGSISSLTMKMENNVKPAVLTRVAQ
jgi:CubicO group peptidase (beta-lactamase class C family)